MIKKVKRFFASFTHRLRIVLETEWTQTAAKSADPTLNKKEKVTPGQHEASRV